jgi:chemotaxis protein methyltransferase CheR
MMAISLTNHSAPPLGFADLLRFSKLLLDRCGLHFSESRRPELEHGIRHAFAASTCSTLDEFYNMLMDSKAGAVEMDLLINAVTISETHFFRDTAQFNALYNQIMPQIIERKRHLRTLRIWSAGCASGEEPYSLAIMVRELIPDIENWSVTILGTDINTASLERARIANYGSWAFREERARQMRLRYFRPSGNRYELMPVIRNMVTFAKLNLAEPVYPSYNTNTMNLDLILCRNVTIYFPETVTRWVADRFYDALVDKGWLVVGHSEPSLEIYKRFHHRNFPDTVVYQRLENAPLNPGLAPFTRPIAPLAPPFSLPPVAPVIAPPVIPAKLEPAPQPQPAAAEHIETLDHARELLEYGRTADALELLNQLQAEKQSAELCSLLGRAHADLSQWEQAENWCRKAFEMDKLALQAYYTLALVLQHQARLDEAIEMMKKVVYIERNYVLGHYGLANLYRESNMLPQALKSLDNALRLLNALAPDSMVSGTTGITVARLRDAIIRQQQSLQSV